MYRLDDLTLSERFFLHLQRERVSYAEIAPRYGVSAQTVYLWTLGRGKVPFVPLDGLTGGEAVWIARRRLGWSREALARRIGVHPRSVARCETFSRKDAKGREARVAAHAYWDREGWPAAHG